MSSRRPRHLEFGANARQHPKDMKNRISSWIAANSPPDTAVVQGAVQEFKPFDAAEAASVEKAVPTRRHEFLTGRAFARSALEQLGGKPCSIPARPDRLPLWPPGFLGSISHSISTCVVQVGRSESFLGLGVDIEPDAALDKELIKLICRAEERVANSEISPMTYFTAKEAFYKSYFPATDRFLDFADVHVECDPVAGVYKAELVGNDKPGLGGARHFIGRFAFLEGHHVASMAIPRL